MIKRAKSELATHAVVFIIFAALAFSYLFILIWCFAAGMRTHADVVLRPFDIDWGALRLRNYLEVFSMLEVGQAGFGRMLFNSLYFSLLGPFLNIMVTMMLAYVTTKYKFFGSKAYFYVVLITMMLPIFGNGGAAYRLMTRLRFINSYALVLTSLSGMGLGYMYFNAFFRTVSATYAEAAEIAGANDWQIFFRVILAQTIPLAGSMYLLAWIGDWNNFAGYLIYLPKIPTLSVGIYLFNSQMTYYARMDILFGASFISVIPPLILFVCFNNVLLSNLSLGGIKE